MSVHQRLNNVFSRINITMLTELLENICIHAHKVFPGHVSLQVQDVKNNLTQGQFVRKVQEIGKTLALNNHLN